MSKTPHPTAAVTALLQPIREAEIAISEASQFLGALEMRAGQNCAFVVIGGRSVALTRLNSGYMPERVPGRQVLLEAVIFEQRQHLIALRSRLEGLRHQLVQAAKAC